MWDFIIILLFNFILLILSIILLIRLFAGQKKINPISNIFIGAFAIVFATMNFIGYIKATMHGGLQSLLFNAVIFGLPVLSGIILVMATLIKVIRK